MATATAGFGEAALTVERAAREHRQRLRESAALGNQPALEELGEVASECGEVNWDGYGARPVEQETLRATYSLLDSLPFGFPLPSISAHPDGQLTLEWYRSPTRNFSISVDPDGWIHYAGLFGAGKHFGTVPSLGGIPGRILRLASEV